MNALHAELLAARSEIRRLTAQRDAAAGVNHSFRERAEAAEEARDQALMKLSSTQHEVSAFRRQRDEVVEALSDLHGAVVKLTNADPTHYEVANAVGLPSLVALQLVERYRPKAVTP
jgi:chromosome segregation ATPase